MKDNFGTPSVPTTPNVAIVQQSTTPRSVVPSEVYSDFFTALQSASYVIVLVSSFLVWNSKKWFQGLVNKHFGMIESLQAESKANLQLTLEQHETIAQLTVNNNVLSRIVAEHIKGLALVSRKVNQNSVHIQNLDDEAKIIHQIIDKELGNDDRT